MQDILSDSAAKSGLVFYTGPFVFARDFRTSFSTLWMAKDVGMALETGRLLIDGDSSQ